MKQLIAFAFLLLLSSCASIPLLNKPIDISRIVLEKERLSQTSNPALQDMIKRDLENRPIKLQNIVVKDILVSGNIDYDYCIVAEVDSKKGKIECFIYSDDTAIIAGLVKNKTKINVSGIFKGFFSMRDHYYLKIEIVRADVHVIPERTGIREFVLEKDKIDKTEDADLQTVMKRDLCNKLIAVQNGRVKDIIVSDGINDKCRVIVETDSEKGKIEYVLYTDNAETISNLDKGKTRVDATGTLIGYHSLSGTHFAKIEIMDAIISIRQ